MDLWRWLLSVDAPDGTSLDALALTCRGLFPWWVAVLIGVPLAAGTIYLYTLEKVRIGLLRRATLMILRMGLIAFVLFLLLRPVLVAEYQGERPRAVVLLVDNSQSLTLRDKRITPQDRLRVAIAHNLASPDTPLTESAFRALRTKPSENPARASLVTAALNHPEWKLRERLETKGPLRTYLFAEHLSGVSGGTEKEPLPGFDTKGIRTSLADALNEVLQRNESAPPAAIVVFTDGRDNASKSLLEDAARECARAGTALHIYGVGSSESGQLQLKEISVPETIFPEDTIAVPVRWRCRGLKQGSVEIILKLGNKEVARREIPVKEGSDLEEVLTFTPGKEDARPDLTKLTATLRLKDTNAYTDQIERPVLVEDRKVKVLYIEDSPRWEYKFLQMNLLRDRRVDARFLLIHGDEKAVASGPPFIPTFPKVQDLRGYDLIILGDVPAGYLGSEKIQQIEEFVKEGGGLVHIAGRQNAPASLHGTPLGDLLPVEFQPRKFPPDLEARPLEFQPQLTRAGERSAMLTLAETSEENRKVWKELAGIYWHYPVTKVRPGAQVLLTHPQARMDNEPMPLAAQHYYGKGIVLFLGLEETWRWRYNTQDTVFGRFWGQVVYQLGMRRRPGTSTAHLALERSENVVGEPGRVFARLFDANFRPLTVERVEGQLFQLDGGDNKKPRKGIELTPIPGLPGEYQGLLPHDQVGKFNLKSRGATIEYRVDLPPQHELTEEGMNETALRQAAQISGGRFYQEEDLHRLVESIEAKRAPFVQRQEIILWGRLSFAIFLLLITAEWVLRKFSNLS